MKPLFIALAALLIHGVPVALAQVPTSTSAVGPYYATPSWDQKLPSTTRFVALSNWNNQAVLDRETGLVWERSTDRTATTWFEAISQCTRTATGGRAGWRLPTVHELLRTVVAGSNFEPVTDSPFTHLAVHQLYWTLSRANPFDSQSFFTIAVGPAKVTVGSADSPLSYVAWCVQSPSSSRSALD